MSISQRAANQIFRVQAQAARPAQRVMRATKASVGGDVAKPQTVVKKRDIGRNDPCYCGSGKKYKHCHYKQDRATATRAHDKIKEVVYNGMYTTSSISSNIFFTGVGLNHLMTKSQEKTSMVKVQSSRMMGADMDATWQKFLRHKVNSFIKWDLVRFFHDNPHTADTAENIARVVGRDAGTVSLELDGLAKAEMLIKETVSGQSIYRLIIRYRRTTGHP